MFTPSTTTSTEFDCISLTTQGVTVMPGQGRGSLQNIMPGQGRGSFQTMSTDLIRSTRGHPLPDEHGKYDLPWAQPLSTTFADYGCALDTGFPQKANPPNVNSALMTTAAGTLFFVSIIWTVRHE